MNKINKQSNPTNIKLNLRKVLFSRYLFILILLNSCSINYFSQTSFVKTIGGLDNDLGQDIIRTLDQGFIVVGNTKSFGSGQNDIYIVKYNKNLMLEWTAVYGTANDENGLSIFPLADSSYVITGSTSNSSFGLTDILVLRISKTGTILWSKIIGGSSGDYSRTVIQTLDNSIILAGNTISVGAGNQDLIICKLDINGNLIWSKIIGGIEYDVPYSIIEGNDSTLYISGYTGSFNSLSSDGFIIKMNINGLILWSKLYGGANDDDIYQIILTPNKNEIVFVGSTTSFGNGGWDVLLGKINLNGDLIWSKTLGNVSNENAHDIIIDPNNNIYITGYTNNNTHGLDDAFIIKTDSNSNIQYSKAIGGTSNDYGYSIDFLENKGILITGNTFSFSGSTSEIFLYRSLNSGDLICNENDMILTTNSVTINSSDFIPTVNNFSSISSITLDYTTGGIENNQCGEVTNINDFIRISDSDFKVSPNPLYISETLKLDYKTDIFKSLTIYDINMNIIFNSNESISSIQLSNLNLNNGIYFIELKTQNYSYIEKLIILR